jgi:dTDP-4-dehydrorhamnose reductase
MKVLVTARNGQLGWELERELNRAQTAGESWAASIECLFLGSAELDITTPDMVTEKVSSYQPDLIINAAAYTQVDRAESDIDAAYAVNDLGVGYLAEAARQVGARMIHVSTDFVFGGQQNTPFLPCDPKAPLGVYGASKLAGENRLLKILGNKRAQVVRTAWVYSEHGANFVKTMIRLMGEREQIGIVSDQIGTPTHARGLAKALWKLATLEVDADQSIYHWTDLGVASWYDFAVAIQEEATKYGLLNKAIPVKPILSAAYPTPARRPHFSVMNTSALREKTGMEGLHWRTALINMIKELK